MATRTASREPLVLLGFMAGVAPRLGLAPGILVLPQRQAVLAAKQAAELDLLSAGRRLGVGISWNIVKFEAPWRRRLILAATLCCKSW